MSTNFIIFCEWFSSTAELLQLNFLDVTDLICSAACLFSATFSNASVIVSVWQKWHPDINAVHHLNIASFYCVFLKHNVM